MTKEEAIKHWMNIACIVYSAEEQVQRKLGVELDRLADLQGKELIEATKKYMRAIAEEILQSFSNEDIEKIQWQRDS